jgi:hypothetical protein
MLDVLVNIHFLAFTIASGYTVNMLAVWCRHTI